MLHNFFSGLRPDLDLVQSAVLFGGSSKFMFHVYVLKSLKTSKRYVGMTSQSVEEKLREHNYSTGIWTRGHKPFKLVYSEAFSTKLVALRRERFFKTGDGRRVLDRILSTV